MFRRWYTFWVTSIIFSCAMSAYDDASVPVFRQYEIEGLEPVTAVIECYVAGNEVGTISYMKIPMLNKYVIHSLYVEPEYRKKGYGTALLQYTCEHLKADGATSIYLQPGPFERGKAPEGYLTTIKPTGEFLVQQLQQLVIFYKKNGFVPTHQWLTRLMKWIYIYMDIEEDAKYLMVKDLTLRQAQDKLVSNQG